MAMNSREKLLAAGVGLAGMLFVGNAIVSTIQSGFQKKKELIASLERKKNDQELELTAGDVARLKLNKVVTKSLPRSEENASADYQKWLISLGEESQLNEPRIQNSGELVEKDGSYHLYKYKLTGTGTIENATQLLYGFYSKDYLQRISQFDMRPIPNSPEPDQLNISLDCEVLALGIAKERQEPPSGDSKRFGKSLDEYKETILGRNLFAPANQPPSLATKGSASVNVGVPLKHTVEAQELDPKQRVTFELVGDVPQGLLIDKDTGSLTGSIKEIGEYKLDVQVTDNGIPRKSSLQSLTIKVNPLPPAQKPPVQFDVASQAMITALIFGGDAPEAWIQSKTESKTYKLRKGDQLKLGGVNGLVKEVGANYVELETEGRKWVVGLDESLAEAYARSKSD